MPPLGADGGVDIGLLVIAAGPEGLTASDDDATGTTFSLLPGGSDSFGFGPVGFLGTFSSSSPASLLPYIGGPLDTVDVTMVGGAGVFASPPGLVDVLVDYGFDGDATLTYEFTIVPVPAALPLLLSGLAGLGLMGWRKRNTA